MLTDEETELVIERLTASLSGVPIRPSLQAVLPVDAMRLLRDDLAYPGQYAREIVAICVKDRWNNAPPWMRLLLNLLPLTPEIEAVKLRIEQPPNVPDPWNVSLLITETPFLDRKTVRTKLSKLNSSTGSLKPILVVTGTTKSGKSWTRLFIEHLHLSNAARFEYTIVRFLADQGLTCSPEALARDILVGFGIRIDTLSPSFFNSTTNQELWPAELAAKVLAEARRDGTCRWIVLDGYAGTTLREDTARFIKGLAERITQGSTYAESFRLVLLGFDGQPGTLAPGRVDPDQTQPITQTDVLTCVNEILTMTELPLTEAAAAVASIMEDLPADAARMEEVERRLNALLITARESRV